MDFDSNEFFYSGFYRWLDFKNDISWYCFEDSGINTFRPPHLRLPQSAQIEVLD